MMQNIMIGGKDSCCGCGVCTIVCPRNAIQMLIDDRGYWYPNVINEKCVKCGICVHKCRFKQKIKKNNDKNI